MSSVDLSVTICTLNRSALLAKCLESLTVQEPGPFTFETIVVDNGSTDDTREAVESFQTLLGNLRYVLEPQLGLARARQTGFEASLGKYVGYLDDDALAAPGWCSAICETFAQLACSSANRIAALGGPIEPDFEIPRPDWLIDELTGLYAIMDLGKELRPYPAGQHPLGANMALLRSALSRDPWNRRLLMCEEVDLFDRLRGKGFQFLYVPGMRIQHFIPAMRLSQEWLLQRYFDEGIARQHLIHGVRLKTRRLAGSAVKLPYTWFRSRSGPERHKLIFRCRAKLYIGTLAGLLGIRSVTSTSYLSLKHGATRRVESTRQQ